MSAVCFILAAIQFALVGFGVDFPTDFDVRNLAAGLFLVALGLLLPGALTIYKSHQSG